MKCNTTPSRSSKILTHVSDSMEYAINFGCISPSIYLYPQWIPLLPTITVNDHMEDSLIF